MTVRAFPREVGETGLIPISNPWFRFKLFFKNLQGKQGLEEQKSRLAKEAFLFVIANYNAFKFQKDKVLGEIDENYPDIDEAVSDEEMFLYFEHLCEEAKRRNEIISPAELRWVEKFVRTAEVRIKIEKLIYRILLGASSHWDEMRRNFNWTISDSEKLELVREFLKDTGIGHKRGMEIAQEFNQPKDDFVRPYFQKLLYDRHYDKAAELKVNAPEIAFNVVVMNINNGYFQDALDITQRFLPERKDLVEEIQQIIAVLNG